MSTITLTADYGYTNYRVDGLADGTVIDASGASWIQDNDASDGQSNPYPFMVENSAGVVLQGGTIDGNINQTDAWRDVYDEGNSAGIRTEGTPNVVISDWRISNTWDAIRVSWDSPDFLIEDVWVTDARDDAVENDRLQSGTIRDSLFDGVFAGMSIDPSSSSPVDGSGETILMDGVLMRLELSLYEGQMTHGSFIKTDSATDGEVTPNLRFIDCVIAIEDVNHRSYRSMFDAWDHTIQSENNYFLNLSDEPLPDDYPMPPAGWTVLQGQEARDYWDAARDEWVAAHAEEDKASLSGSAAGSLNGDAVANTIDGTAADDQISGGGGDDTLNGGNGNDSVQGGADDDLIYGGVGDDTLPGQDGNDTIYGEGGNDLMGGGAGNDRLFGGAGNDRAGAGSGDDTINAGDGNDSFSGGAGNDVITLGNGNDRGAGSDGNDKINGGAGHDRIGGGLGRDSINAGSGNDTVGAGGSNDTIDGGIGNDALFGGTGNDLIYGGANDDTINSGFGDDTVYGGTGADIFVFNALNGGGTTVVMDFEDGTDALRIVGLRNTNDPLGRLDITDITYQGGDAVEMSYGDHTIIVVGASATDFGLDDFILA